MTDKEQEFKKILEDLAEKVYTHEGVWHPDSANEFYEMVLAALLPYRKGSTNHGAKAIGSQELKKLIRDGELG